MSIENVHISIIVVCENDLRIWIKEPQGLHFSLKHRSMLLIDRIVIFQTSMAVLGSIEFYEENRRAPSKDAVDQKKVSCSMVVKTLHVKRKKE